MKILLTGFAPFGGERVNPSYQAVMQLPEHIGGAEVIRLEIPTEFAAAPRTVEEAIGRFAPDAVLSVGQAAGRKCITVEKVAINYADASIPDNAGAQPRGEALVPGGPDAYFSTLPITAMAEHVRTHGLPCEISYSAGVYVCNCVMYCTLHFAAGRTPKLPVGFVHVPCSREQLAGRETNTPSLPLSEITQALFYAVEAIAVNTRL